MPAPAIVATAGSASANSYLSVASADTIANGMVGTLAWSTATSDDKARALITATNGLETLEWIGTRTSATQALSWPRTDATCGDKVYRRRLNAVGANGWDVPHKPAAPKL